MGDAQRRTESGDHQLVKDADRGRLVRERSAELLDETTPWQDRQAAARQLGELGDASALPALRQAFANDSDYDVREATVISIAALERDAAVLRADLHRAMLDQHSLVWKRAATLLVEHESSEAAVAALLARLGVEADATAIGDLGQALLDVGGDSTLTEHTLDLLRSHGVDDSAKAVLLVRIAKPVAEPPRALLSEAFAEALPRLEGWVIDEAFRRVIELNGPDFALAGLLADPRLPGRLTLLPEVRGSVEGRLTYEPGPIMSRYLDALSDVEEGVRNEAVERLRVRIPALGPDEKQQLAGGVKQAVVSYGTGLGLLSLLVGDDAAIEFLVTEIQPPTQSGARAALLDARPLVESLWVSRAAELLPFVLIACDDEDWRVRQNAAQFFGSVAETIPRDELETVETTLERLKSDADVDVRQAAEIALISVRGQRRRTDTRPLIELLTSDTAEGEQEVQDAITTLLDMREPDAVRPVVQAWARWIALRNRSGLVEFAAQKLRTSSQAVIPLLDQLEQGLPLDLELEGVIVHEVVPRAYYHLAAHVADGKPFTRGADTALAAEWLAARRGKQTPTTALNGSEAAKGVSMLVSELVEEERVRRELLVRQRVSRELSEMSDERFFDKSAATFEAIRSELVKHAIPILGRRLDDEDDSTIRENIARVLGNVGGREAVDVLARAVVGEERKRSNRQELLAEYYLKPSKERSDQAATILHDAVAEAKRTLRLLQWLNVAFFAIGLAILAGGFVVMVFGSSETVKILGGLAGLAGFLGIAVQLVREPLVRIQNAVTRLVQVETAFASFIWELNLNGTYIQSQYVAEGILHDDEIASTVDRIERAMHLSMDLVARYAEEGRAPAGPRISSVVPQAGGAGCHLTAYGAGLKSAGKNGSARVAVNHVPIAAGSLDWSDSVVSFTLPEILGEKLDPGEAVWISLLVDGHETNAVPFRLTGAARNGG